MTHSFPPRRSCGRLGTDRPPPPSPFKACIRACRSVSHASAGTEASRRSALPYHPLRLFLAPESAVPFDVLTLLWIAAVFLLGGAVKGVIGLGLPTIALGLFAATMDIRAAIARKSVVSGKSVSARVDLGGRRIINKKHKE